MAMFVHLTPAWSDSSPIRWWPKFVIMVIALLLAAGAGFSLRGSLAFNRDVTVTSLSPDDSLRIIVVEHPSSLDRNFDVVIEDVATQQSRVVFHSPDEGRPIGSERVVWSADGSRFLILGRHFYIAERGKLPTGDQIYLMVDVRSGQMWCNASQQNQYPGFGIEDVRAIRWHGWALP